ncbi:MAG TPA: hypothetical protein VL995_12195 [Cellvibrio sp.]|nr:hypothetical protein [Cellvibrio sp.]
MVNRKTNRDVVGEGSLYRCNIKSTVCEKFGEGLPVVNRTFRLHIDKKDHVYMADTSRHQLWVLDSNGKITANKTGFRFPNQIIARNDELLLADTNNHKIKVIENSVSGFGNVLQSIPAALDSSSPWWKPIKDNYSWPVNMAWVENQFWVLIGNNNLSFSRLAIYDVAGHFTQEITLPEGADPISILEFDDKVLLIDMALYQVHQFSKKGIFLGSVFIEDKTGTITRDSIEAKKWLRLQENTIIVFVLMLVLGFGAAIWDHLRGDAEVAHLSLSRKQKDALTLITPNGVWLEVNKFPRVMAKLIFPYLGILVILSATFIFLDIELRVKLILPHLAMLFGLGIFLMPIVQMTRWKLGIFKDRVEIIDHRNQHYVQPFDTLSWNNSGFIIGQVVVPFRMQVKKSLFPHQKMNEMLVPFFLPKNKIGIWKMLKYQWNSPEKMLKASTILMVIGAIVLIFQQ